MLKKLTLLAMAVGALIAFAAPSMASADEWATNGTPIGGESEADPVHFTGTLSSTKGPVKISCDATANTELWNDGSGVGRATLTLSPDPTDTEFCTVAVFNPEKGAYQDIPCHVNPIVNGGNWPITTAGTVVSIENVSFTNEFVGAPCLTILGIPSGTQISDGGTATGEANEEGCIIFNNTGPLNNGSRIDGFLCPTESGLTL